MQSVKAAMIVCLALVTGVGTWFLRVWVPDHQWRLADEAGCRCLSQERFGEAERRFSIAVATARSFGNPDTRLGISLFHLAQALVGQSKENEAVALLEQSVMIHSKALGSEHPEVLRIHQYQTALLRKLGRTDHANARAVQQRPKLLQTPVETVKSKPR